MGLFQEAAILMGDVVTQPVRRIVAQNLTGIKFRIERNDRQESYIDPQKHKIVRKHKVTWDIKPNGKVKRSKPTYTAYH